VKKYPEDNFLDLFMGNLKENIQHEVIPLELKFLEKTFMVVGKLKVKIWLLEGSPLAPIESIMFHFLTPLNLQG
jgi:hypothetical protein